MNRKTKNRIKIAAVALFFLGAGISFFVWDARTKAKETQEEQPSVLSVTQTGFPEENILPEESGTDPELQEEVVVYVCGAVNTPGVYILPLGSRLYEALDLAGGLSENADASYHNLARCISDGERIYILSLEETKELSASRQVAGEEVTESNSSQSGLVNLNTATLEQMMTLPGIGEAKAKDILEYRTRIGQFTSAEEIKNVSGIGDAMFERIKDKITVE